ncbi:MAG: 50S ribosomal protein L29 [Patescibacteria group bacterium]
MDISDIRKKADADIRVLITGLREELRVFRFGGAGSRTRNVKEGRGLRRRIARMHTVLKERELEIVKK